ncbi:MULTISPECIES: GNAT family N-acetyltransferase [unclassified Streptomyces]|uniref:GNAT family N-acetyltransferase n=1 Tax=unclassified Streptomyces TaxID=2593676 RepID=UPI000377B5B2|nr:GNAT family N-acetyltransferase [Streptomyces sp. HmicA12]
MSANGLTVRPMALGDCDAVAEVRVRGWQFAYAGLLPRAHLDALSVPDVTAHLRETFGRRHPDLVAERAGAVVGWACHGPTRDADVPPGDGELYALYVREEQLSTGVGRALMGVCLADSAATGRSVIRLWVLEGNARARRFYERAGFVADGARAPYEVAGETVPEIRYVRALAPRP